MGATYRTTMAKWQAELDTAVRNGNHRLAQQIRLDMRDLARECQDLPAPGMTETI